MWNYDSGIIARCRVPYGQSGGNYAKRQMCIRDSHYNLVGFQTRLKWGEQKKVFSMIPGLENAEFVRFGVMHRNTYLNSPFLLKQDWSWQKRGDLFFAGQITGVEGYMESAASGLMAGINACLLYTSRCV